MSFSFDGSRATPTRPPHIEPAQPGNWARDAAGGEPDGTVFTASFANMVAGNLRRIAQDAGVALTPGVDTILRDAVIATVEDVIAQSAVTSVFGRAGAVVAANNDYSASQIANNSGVAGATVGAALINIDQRITGWTPGAEWRTQLLDSIASQFNGTLTTFNLRLSGAAVTPIFAADLIVSLDGVIQAPGAGFTISGSTIVFAAAPLTGAECFILYRGRDPLAPAMNFLINGDFAINMRLFAGGALAAGVYGFDRWKAGAAGADVSVANTIVTLASGQIEQIVEGALWGSLGGQKVTISVENLTGGALNVVVGSQSGQITAGAGRRGVTLTLGSGETGNISVRLSPATTSVSFQRVKLEIGEQPTAWVRRSVVQEEDLCARYFQKSYARGARPGAANVFAGEVYHIEGATPLAAKVGMATRLTPMRATPTIVWYASASGASGVINGSGLGDVAIASTNNASTAATGFPNLASAQGSAGALWRAQFTADAEL
ncbi:MAG: hypothetical protein NW215_10850 [Hyphomicrobiales bacterium]|nr:hypothetical protein [Hyphomicrobiales bacterium]